jgi:hypothetical protein
MADEEEEEEAEVDEEDCSGNADGNADEEGRSGAEYACMEVMIAIRTTEQGRLWGRQREE